MPVHQASPTGFHPRRAAVERLDAVLRGDQFAPFSQGEIADARDRAQANRLVTLALRRHGHINAVIDALMPRGVPKRAGLFEPVLRLGLAGLLFGSAGDDDHAILFLAGEIAKSDPKARHLLRLLNGVLRNAQRRRTEFAALPGAALFPDWLGERWRRQYGDAAFAGFAEALVLGAPLDISVMPGVGNVAETLGGTEVIKGIVRLEHRDRRVSELPGYDDGHWWVQDVAASLPARLIDLETGAKVLDLCAAPGGKTAQLIAAGYKVTAVDSEPNRIDLLKANLDRLKLTAEVVCADARTFGDGREFDAVLVDAPCSATGTFRRHPEIVWQRKEPDFAQRAKLQCGIVENALGRLRAGGILVYSTCSLETEEGEEVVARVMDNHRDLGIRPVTAAEIGGIANAVAGSGFVRTHPAMALPNGAHGMDGFFIARFVRA